MVVDTSTELTSEKLHEMGGEKVRSFSKKWGILGVDTKLEPAWWENNIKNHLSEGREIKSPVLKSLYQEYLDEYYGVKDEAELRKIFMKDMDRFAGTEEDEKKAFGGYLFNNFSDWMKGPVPAAIAKERDKFEFEPEREIEKKNKSERESGERIDLKINWEKVSELAPWLRNEFREFEKIWASGNVVELTLGLEGDAITSIGLTGDGGKYASVPIEKIFGTVDGVEDFRNSITGKAGFKFSVSGEYIDPDTGISLAKRILCKVAIGDKKLNNDFWVHKSNLDKGQVKETRRI
ncbi:MAG: hypothetical protein NTZ07_03580 [Candidatus Woesebacteria bacterium]|nr:hypothetical protein [Candidatus Woesebacteria bacterium]